jgi:predicted MPP superfamily phosphohydrolase
MSKYFLFILLFYLFSCNKYFNQTPPETIASTSVSNFKIAHITDIHIGEGRLDFSGKGFEDILQKDTEELYPEIRLRNAVESINAKKIYLL